MLKKENSTIKKTSKVTLHRKLEQSKGKRELLKQLRTCLVFRELYSQCLAGEDWIKYTLYKNWAHEACTPGGYH